MDRNITAAALRALPRATFPARGTWIEMGVREDETKKRLWTFPARGTWIEIFRGDAKYLEHWTFPARGTWIEITRLSMSGKRREDVPRKGNVDRNITSGETPLVGDTTFPARGTWIEMSRCWSHYQSCYMTFPARGTWIEMSG